MLGSSDQFRPSSSRPPAFGVRPPHCLKKNATPRDALVAQFDDPLLAHRPVAAARLAAGDHPIDAGESRPRAARAAARREMNRTAAGASRRRRRGRRSASSRRSRPSRRSAARHGELREPLVRLVSTWYVCQSARHGLEDLGCSRRDVLVEEVAHRVDEDEPRAAPTDRLWVEPPEARASGRSPCSCERVLPGRPAPARSRANVSA